MDALQSILWLIVAGGGLVWFVHRLVRLSVSLVKADSVKTTRWFISLLVWVAASTLAYWFGAKNFFVLGGVASTIALVRFFPNWGIGLVLFLVGLPYAIGGFICSLFWPSHSVKEVLLLDSSISVIFTGSLATGYGLFLCAVVSIVWGLAIGEGFPKTRSARNGAPFTVESEVPDHVIQTSQPHT